MHPVYHGWTAATITPAIPAFKPGVLPQFSSPVAPTPIKTSAPDSLSVGAHGILSTVFGPHYAKILNLTPGGYASVSPQPIKPAQNDIPTSTIPPDKLKTNLGQPTSGWIAPSSVTNVGTDKISSPIAAATENSGWGLGVPKLTNRFLY